MAQLLVIGGLFAASLPGLLRRLGRGLSAAEWARMCQMALVGGAAMVVIGAASWAVASLFATIGGPSVAVWCARMVGPFSVVDARSGVVAGLVAVAMVVTGWREWRRTGRQLRTVHIEPSVGRHEQWPGFGLVTLPTSVCAAYSVTSPTPQVVITDGLRTRLTPEQLRAVVAHEGGHLAHRHPTRLRRAAVAAAALAWWPPTRRSHRALRTAYERWADEVATGSGRHQRTVLRDAIVAVAMNDHPAPVAAFSLAEATAERIDAMDRSRSATPAIRFGLYLPGVIAVAVGLAIIADCVSRTQRIWPMCASCLS